MAKGFRGQSCQACFPSNVKFAQEVQEPRFEKGAVFADKDARTLATAILAMSEDEFRTAFKGSPMKRAKLAGVRRNAGVVLQRMERDGIQADRP